MDSGNKSAANSGGTESQAARDTDGEITRTFSEETPNLTVPLASWGHFRDLRLIGSGGFGSVYRAWDTQLHRDVALKLIAAENSGEIDTGGPLQEARMMARVRQANIVPVYGVGVVDGFVGIWSELIEGQSLGARVKKGGPLQPREAARMVVELCNAVAALHAAGTLHRDIKAENALEDVSGRVLLTDFGLSRDPSSKLVGGTLPYMAPELFAGRPASAATDIYSLGVLLYFLASARTPAPRVSGDFRRELAAGNLVPLDEAKPGLPKAFLDIVSRATARHPESRFATAEGLRLALESFAAGQPASRPATRIPPAVAVLTAAVLTVAAVAAGFWTWHTGTAGRGSSAPGAYGYYAQAHALMERRDRPGNAAASTELFEKAVRADPGFALAHAELADSLWEQYRQTHDKSLRERAAAEAEQALKIQKDLPQAFIVEGRIHQASGSRSLAMTDLTRALALAPRNADVHRELAQAYDAEGRGDDAAAAFQTAIDLDPRNWWNYNARGVWLARRGDVSEASSMFGKVLELLPDNIWGLANLARVRIRQDRTDEARVLLEKSIALAPTDPWPRTTLGFLLMEAGKYDEAGKQYRAATELNPKSYVAWAALASATEFGAEGMEKARPIYEKAIELAEKEHRESPSNATVTANLGNYYAALGRREQALPLLRNALALAPDDTAVLVEVSEGYEELGLRSKSLPLLTEALKRGYPAGMVKRIPELAPLIGDRNFRWPRPPKPAETAGVKQQVQ